MISPVDQRIRKDAATIEVEIGENEGLSMDMSYYDDNVTITATHLKVLMA